MMSRRDFIKDLQKKIWMGVLVLGGFAFSSFSLVRCSSSSGGRASVPDACLADPGTPPRFPSDGSDLPGFDKFVTGFPLPGGGENSHVHIVYIPMDDLKSVPADCKSYWTSSANNHQHILDITVAQFNKIINEGGASIETSVVEGHNHVVAIVLT